MVTGKFKRNFSIKEILEAISCLFCWAAIIVVIFDNFYPKEFIEKKYFPRKYWTQQVNSLEFQIEELERELELVSIDYEKERVNSYFEQLRSRAVLTDEQFDKFHELDLRIEEISAKHYVGRMRRLQTSIDSTMHDLKQAKQELNKY